MLQNFVQTVSVRPLLIDGLSLELANPQAPFNLPADGCGYVLLMERSTGAGACIPLDVEIVAYDGYEEDGVTLKLTDRGVGDTVAREWNLDTVVQQPFLAEHYQCIMDAMCGLEGVAISHATKLLKQYALLLDQDKRISKQDETFSGQIDKLNQGILGFNSRLMQVEKNQELLIFSSWSMFDYIAELNRMAGQSGIVRARKYEYTGAEAYHSPTSTGYSPYNGHSHANFENLVGTGEFSWMANGIYGRSRHNDDGLYQHAPLGEDYDDRTVIEPPALPADIASLASPDEQIERAKLYIKAMAGEIEVTAVDHFEDAAQWVMTGVEVFPEVYKQGESLRDPFRGHRHQINVDTLPELFKQEAFYNNGGHKNIRENSLGIAMAINDIDDKGNPVVVLWRYRFISAPVGSLADYPVDDVMEYFEDNANSHRFGMSYSDMIKSRQARFKIKQSLANDDTDRPFNRPSLIDELIGKISGLDGYGNTLTEEYHYYGANDQLKQYGDTSTPLKAGYYNRWYTMTGNDASNRRNAMRGFTDDKLWVARTTSKRIKATTFGSESYAFSYFIPLEMHLQSFLNGNFNPYGLEDLGSEYSYQQYRALISAGMGHSEDNPLPGFSRGGGFYLTPSEIFSATLDSDPADTIAQGGYWIRCEDGIARKHHAAGYGYFLPTYGVTKDSIRTRYPIYAAHFEGSEAFKYIEASRKDQCGVMALQVRQATNYLKQQKRLLGIEEALS